jgi:flagellar biogenesis protein FliO|tara:strand:- start:490 stop:780 length:291 start_codon:yes stop_codon:yes gene_type:complete
MTYEKIAMVIIFLGALLAVQIYLYARYRSDPKANKSISGLKVISRLNLSKTSQLNIVNAGDESFLIVCCKNSSAAIVPLNSEKITDNPEGLGDARV